MQFRNSLYILSEYGDSDINFCTEQNKKLDLIGLEIYSKY
jgi:hypothetical protein